MLSTTQEEQSNGKEKTNIEPFSFLYEENLSQEQFEKNMNLLMLISPKETEKSKILSIDEEIIVLMVNNCAKYNNFLYLVKLLINMSQINKKNNLNNNLCTIDFNEYIIKIFKKMCELVESTKNSLKSENTNLSFIINNYADILIITSDYFSKEFNSVLSLSEITKYIHQVVQEKIYTFYLTFSIILYDLCKYQLNSHIKQYIDLLKLNQIPLTSSALNSYIDLLCRSNRLEDCQSFFDEIIPYKPLLSIPYCLPESNNSYINMNPNDSKAIYEKHILSFGINIVSFGIFLKYLCKNDHLDLALFYFDQLNSKKMLKDEIIFNLILNGCSKKGDFDNLYRVYEEMLNNGIKPTSITMNTIIDAFIRSNEIEKAWKIFGEMFKNQINPDNFTLSTLFRGIKNMNHKEYLIKGINLVKQRSDKIDIILINVLLDACIKLKDSKDFLELFDSLIKGKFSNNNTENSDEKNNENKIIINNVIKPDLITYNTYIKGCTQLKLYDKLDYVYEHIINNKEVNIIPNDVTFNSLIDAYVRQNNMNKVFKLISTMQQYHIKPDNFTYTTIIKGLNKDSFSSNNNNDINNNYKNKNKDELDLAFQLFEKVKQISKPDEILYNCIMDACLRFNKVDKMLELYKEMIENNISPSSVTCGIVIKGYGMKGDVDSALKIYQHMKINKIQISNITYGCLINVCTKNNKLSKAFELYESLTKEGIEMNTILYTTLIKAYSKTRNLNKVIEILNKMNKLNNAKPNIITYNSVIDCCIKCNNFDMAYKYFNYLLNSSVNSNNIIINNNINENLILKPDIVTFSTLIKGEIHNGCFDKARILMNKLLELDYIHPDCILLNTLLDGCEKCSCYNEALDIFKLFRKKGVTMNMMTYSILLKILGILGDFDNSLKLFEEIKNLNNKIPMNLIIITCFIKTCFSTNHIKEAINTFNSIKNYNINPDTISYITMINGIINNTNKNDSKNNIEYAKELIKIIKSSANDHITFYDKNYLKVINYLKKIDNNREMTNDLIKFLNENGLFNYQYKNGKNKNYNNSIDNRNLYDNEDNEDNKENNKDISSYKNNSYYNKKNKYNNNSGYDNNKKRMPLRQIYNNYNNNTFNNNNKNMNWKKNNYNNSDYNYYEVDEKNNNRYKNYNNFGTNNKWKNTYNNDKNYYNNKKGNNNY